MTDAVLHLCGVTRKFLAQPNRGGILEMGTTNLDDIIEALGAIEQCGV